MSDLVEAVAKAICKADGIDPETELVTHFSKDFWWELYLKEARAAIAAVAAYHEAAGLRCGKDCQVQIHEDRGQG